MSIEDNFIFILKLDVELFERTLKRNSSLCVGDNKIFLREDILSGPSGSSCINQGWCSESETESECVNTCHQVTGMLLCHSVTDQEGNYKTEKSSLKPLTI